MDLFFYGKVKDSVYAKKQNKTIEIFLLFIDEDFTDKWQ